MDIFWVCLLSSCGGQALREGRMARFTLDTSIACNSQSTALVLRTFLHQTCANIFSAYIKILQQAQMMSMVDPYLLNSAVAYHQICNTRGWNSDHISSPPEYNRRHQNATKRHVRSHRCKRVQYYSTAWWSEDIITGTPGI